MKRNLVRCPNCEINGKKEVLGEIDNNGNFIVMRFHKGTTIISGDKLNVKCGVCNEIVYRKEVNNGTNSSIGVAWFSRQTFVQTLGSLQGTC